jgi:cyclopropane-fatty-acyl-phospholipid synthase
MSVREELRAAGTSAAAIAQHYDVSDDLFRLFLGDDLVYSCALWEEGDDLAAAQRHKIDWFADRLPISGAHVLDVGCGWGALLDRFARIHGMASGVGLTLSRAQQAAAARRGTPGADYRVESWVEHEPDRPYDLVTAIESTEHFASDRLTADEKVEVYQAFFERVAAWLADGGRVGLQLICLDGVGHAGSRPGRGPVADLINQEIFPEAMSSSLGEMASAWETRFRLLEFAGHTEHYVRTFRAWAQRFRDQRAEASALVGDDLARTFSRYFAAGEVLFRLREQALYRVVLEKRPRAKAWAVPPVPSVLARAESDGAGASPEAIRAHYDVSNSFYAAWLGPTMTYSSGLWRSGDPPDLDAATHRKIDFFAGHVLPAGATRVLDVGCGWGETMRRLVGHHGVRHVVGLTLSEQQREFVERHTAPGIEVRLESWEAYAADDGTFDAIFSFGAFEHFARDGLAAPERVARYRAFFGRCYRWLRPGGRLALETIAHDDAPDTAAPLGRGPRGDVVLELFPESICPQLSEVVLGFEPWFEVELLRSDAADFARTFRAWLVALRRAESAAAAAAGAETVRRFRRYLAASEVQFRDGTLTNLRLVLRRRAEPKR